MLRDIENRLLAVTVYLGALLALWAVVQYDLIRYWPLLVSGTTLILLLTWLWRAWWRRRTRGRLLGDLAIAERMKALSWREFEQACAGLFERRGYDITLTRASSDGGVDIVLRKDGTKGIAQCKHWSNRPVSVSQVRELLGAKQDFGADRAFMLTSGFATEEARGLADRNDGLYVWDRNNLTRQANALLMRDAAREVIRGETPDQPEAPAVPTDRICPQCGQKLVVRDGRYGRFIGCTGFPECRYTRDLIDGEEDGTA